LDEEKDFMTKLGCFIQALGKEEKKDAVDILVKIHEDYRGDSGDTFRGVKSFLQTLIDFEADVGNWAPLFDNRHLFDTKEDLRTLMHTYLSLQVEQKKLGPAQEHALFENIRLLKQFTPENQKAILAFFRARSSSHCRETLQKIADYDQLPLNGELRTRFRKLVEKLGKLERDLYGDVVGHS
jgi:hypothetical protein